MPPANFYRAMQNRQPQGIAQAVALTFMGERAEKWPKERLAGLAAFFEPISYKSTGEWKEEIVYLDPAKVRDAGRSSPTARPLAGGARAGPARGVRQLADLPGQPLVRPQCGQPDLVLAAGARHHPRAGRHPARQPAGKPAAAGLPGAGTGRPVATTSSTSAG